MDGQETGNLRSLRHAALRVPTVKGTLPHVVFPLLTELHKVNYRAAERIRDINHFVLRGIRQDEIKDSEMVNWVRDDIVDAFNAVAPPQTRFGCLRGTDLWGYWDNADTDP